MCPEVCKIIPIGVDRLVRKPANGSTFFRCIFSVISLSICDIKKIVIEMQANPLEYVNYERELCLMLKMTLAYRVGSTNCLAIIIL